MFNIGPAELMVILILGLILLGPEKLPEVARTVGKGMKELRRMTEDLRATVEEEIYQEPSSPARPVVPPVAAGGAAPSPGPAAVAPEPRLADRPPPEKA